MGAPVLLCSHAQHDLSRAQAQSGYPSWRFTLMEGS